MASPPTPPPNLLNLAANGSSTAPDCYQCHFTDFSFVILINCTILTAFTLWFPYIYIYMRIEDHLKMVVQISNSFAYIGDAGFSSEYYLLHTSPRYQLVQA